GKRRHRLFQRNAIVIHRGLVLVQASEEFVLFLVELRLPQNQPPVTVWDEPGFRLPPPQAPRREPHILRDTKVTQQLPVSAEPYAKGAIPTERFDRFATTTAPARRSNSPSDICSTNASKSSS